MKEQDIQSLGLQEKRVLNLSFRDSLSEKRVRNIVLSTLMALAAVVLLSIYGASLAAITAMALAILVISAVEKISYAREILVYKSLVRDLTHRVEQLENVELTASGGHPADSLKQLDSES